MSSSPRLKLKVDANGLRCLCLNSQLAGYTLILFDLCVTKNKYHYYTTAGTVHSFVEKDFASTYVMFMEGVSSVTCIRFLAVSRERDKHKVKKIERSWTNEVGEQI